METDSTSENSSSEDSKSENTSLADVTKKSKRELRLEHFNRLAKPIIRVAQPQVSDALYSRKSAAGFPPLDRPGTRSKLKPSYQMKLAIINDDSDESNEDIVQEKQTTELIRTMATKGQNITRTNTIRETAEKTEKYTVLDPITSHYFKEGLESLKRGTTDESRLKSYIKQFKKQTVRRAKRGAAAQLKHMSRIRTSIGHQLEKSSSYRSSRPPSMLSDRVMYPGLPVVPLHQHRPHRSRRDRPDNRVTRKMTKSDKKRLKEIQEASVRKFLEKSLKTIQASSDTSRRLPRSFASRTSGFGSIIERTADRTVRRSRPKPLSERAKGRAARAYEKSIRKVRSGLERTQQPTRRIRVPLRTPKTAPARKVSEAISRRQSQAWEKFMKSKTSARAPRPAPRSEPPKRNIRNPKNQESVARRAKQAIEKYLNMKRGKQRGDSTVVSEKRSRSKKIAKPANWADVERRRQEAYEKSIIARKRAREPKPEPARPSGKRPKNVAEVSNRQRKAYEKSIRNRTQAREPKPEPPRASGRKPKNVAEVSKRQQDAYEKSVRKRKQAREPKPEPPRASGKKPKNVAKVNQRQREAYEKSVKKLKQAREPKPEPPRASGRKPKNAAEVSQRQREAYDKSIKKLKQAREPKPAPPRASGKKPKNAAEVSQRQQDAYEKSVRKRKEAREPRPEPPRASGRKPKNAAEVRQRQREAYEKSITKLTQAREPKPAPPRASGKKPKNAAEVSERQREAYNKSVQQRKQARIPKEISIKKPTGILPPNTSEVIKRQATAFQKAIQKLKNAREPKADQSRKPTATKLPKAPEISQRQKQAIEKSINKLRNARDKAVQGPKSLPPKVNKKHEKALEKFFEGRKIASEINSDVPLESTLRPRSSAKRSSKDDQGLKRLRERQRRAREKSITRLRKPILEEQDAPRRPPRRSFQPLRTPAEGRRVLATAPDAPDDDGDDPRKKARRHNRRQPSQSRGKGPFRSEPRKGKPKPSKRKEKSAAQRKRLPDPDKLQSFEQRIIDHLHPPEKTRPKIMSFKTVSDLIGRKGRKITGSKEEIEPSVGSTTIVSKSRSDFVEHASKITLFESTNADEHLLKLANIENAVEKHRVHTNFPYYVTVMKIIHATRPHVEFNVNEIARFLTEAKAKNVGRNVLNYVENAQSCVDRLAKLVAHIQEEALIGVTNECRKAIQFIKHCRVYVHLKCPNENNCQNLTRKLIRCQDIFLRAINVSNTKPSLADFFHNANKVYKVLVKIMKRLQDSTGEPLLKQSLDGSIQDFERSFLHAFENSVEPFQETMKTIKLPTRVSQRLISKPTEVKGFSPQTAKNVHALGDVAPISPEKRTMLENQLAEEYSILHDEVLSLINNIRKAMALQCKKIFKGLYSPYANGLMVIVGVVLGNARKLMIDCIKRADDLNEHGRVLDLDKEAKRLLYARAQLWREKRECANRLDTEIESYLRNFYDTEVLQNVNLQLAVVLEFYDKASGDQKPALKRLCQEATEKANALDTFLSRISGTGGIKYVENIHQMDQIFGNILRDAKELVIRQI